MYVSIYIYIYLYIYIYVYTHNSIHSNLLRNMPLRRALDGGPLSQGRGGHPRALLESCSGNTRSGRSDRSDRSENAMKTSEIIGNYGVNKKISKICPNYSRYIYIYIYIYR